ncbi:MAG: TolC family protein [Alistipes sp.]|nr:TolC family protein [Alistipes sp.]
MRTFITTLALLCYFQSYAQSVISLEQAAQLTFSNNSTIKAIEHHNSEAQYNRKAAVGLFFPQINIHGAWIHSQKNISIDANPLKGLLKDFNITPLLGLDWSYKIQNRTFSFLEADITIPIFTGGKIIAANRAAKSNQRAISAQGVIESQKIFTTLVNRYFGYILATDAVTVRNDAVKGLKQHLNDILALQENGLATNAEVLYVKYSLSEAESLLNDAIAERATIHKALCTTIGIDTLHKASTNIFIVDKIESLSHFQALAEQNNPQIEYIKEQVNLAKENIAVNRADFSPQIAAIAGGALTQHVTELLPRWAIGIGVNFKLFDGSRREFKYLAAKQTFARVKELETTVEQDIRLLLESLYNNCTSALSHCQSAESSISFAKEYLRMKQIAFDQGVATSTDVVDATLNLARSQIEHLKAAYQFDINLAQLLEASGCSYDFFKYSNSVNKRVISYENN